MKAVICLAMLCWASAVFADQAGECSMVGYYRELGCKELPLSGSMPVTTASGEACPDSFKCPDWKQRDPKKCYYRDKAYEDRAPIPQSEMRNPCKMACACSAKPEPTVDCAAVDCVENIDSEETAACHLTYSLTECCSDDKLCDEEKIAKLPTCLVEGRSYRGGQLFEPSNTRLKCICTADYKPGVFNETYCKEIECGVELDFQPEIKKNCAPVFYQKPTGCPIQFQCQNANSTVVRSINKRGVKGLCSFGDLSLAVGDYVEVSEPCVRCQCDVPPYVTCIKDNSLCDTTTSRPVH